MSIRILYKSNQLSCITWSTETKPRMSHERQCMSARDYIITPHSRIHQILIFWVPPLADAAWRLAVEQTNVTLHDLAVLIIPEPVFSLRLPAEPAHWDPCICFPAFVMIWIKITFSPVVSRSPSYRPLSRINPEIYGRPTTGIWPINNHKKRAQWKISS